MLRPIIKIFERDEEHSELRILYNFKETLTGGYYKCSLSVNVLKANQLD